MKQLSIVITLAISIYGSSTNIVLSSGKLDEKTQDSVMRGYLLTLQSRKFCTPALTKEQIERIAKIARASLSPINFEKFVGQITNMDIQKQLDDWIVANSKKACADYQEALKVLDEFDE